MSLAEERDVVMEETEVVAQECKAPHIAFLLTYGFAARMMLRSGAGRQLVARGVRVTAISPNADEVYFQQECQEDNIALEQEPQGSSRIAELFRAYRPYLLDDVMGNVALRTKHIRRSGDHPVLHVTLATINKYLTRRSWFRQISISAEHMLNRSKKIKDFLADLRPDLLILPNPFGALETLYLLHAKELGMPTVCQMLSWDNITTKGTPLLMPDYFISWGPIMTKEMIEIYHFSKEKIYECGVPHFDVYFQKDHFTPRDVLTKELNIPPEHPYILYGMVAPIFCPNELDILKWLVDQIGRNAFIKPCALVIRPHPQTIRGSYAMNSQEIDKLRALVGPHVALDLPPVLSDRLAWDLPKSDMYRLASLLAGSAMCLSAGSTLCLDACMLDCPVINIGFDGWEELPYEKSARRGLDFTHIMKLLALQGVRVVRSFRDIAEHINGYLRNHCVDQEGRARSAAQECGPQDGRATERVVNTLLRLSQSSK